VDETPSPAAAPSDSPPTDPARLQPDPAPKTAVPTNQSGASDPDDLAPPSNRRRRRWRRVLAPSLVLVVFWTAVAGGAAEAYVESVPILAVPPQPEASPAVRRNAFLTQDVSFERKTREFALAVNLERQYSKDQILERYLNTIYFGREAYGIAAAAHAYFGVTPDRLTFAQGAVLAAVIKDPWRYDPDNDAKDARYRWDWIVKSARGLGWAPAGDVAYPKARPPQSAVADRMV
jgi:hypothetical protein